MYYIIIFLLIFIFFYAMFIDGKQKIDINYDEESSYSDEDIIKNPRVIYGADKNKYHFKSSFIGIFIENNLNENIAITRDYEVEILKDDKWYKLPVENVEDVTSEVILKPKDSFYQNVFIDKYKNLQGNKIRIIKKAKIGENTEIYKTEVSIHSNKFMKEKENIKKEEKD